MRVWGPPPLSTPEPGLCSPAPIPTSMPQIPRSEQRLGLQGPGEPAYEVCPALTGTAPPELEHEGGGELQVKGLGQDTASASDSYFLPTSLTPKVFFLSLSSLYVSLGPTPSFSALVSWFQKNPSPRGDQEVWPGSWGAPWPWSSSSVWLLLSSFCITGSRRAGWRWTGAGECKPAHPLYPQTSPTPPAAHPHGLLLKHPDL